MSRAARRPSRPQGGATETGRAPEHPGPVRVKTRERERHPPQHPAGKDHVRRQERAALGLQEDRGRRHRRVPARMRRVGPGGRRGERAHGGAGPGERPRTSVWAFV